MNSKFYLMMLVVATMFVSCKENKSEDFINRVYLVTPTIQGSDNQKSYSGTVEATNDISLGFKTPGELTRIYVKEGDFVRKGELLAELDDSDYKLGVEALEIQYKQVKDEVSRVEKLYQQKSVSVNDYEKAQAGLKQLAVQLQLNKNKLEYTKLYAPTDGYIISVNFSKAEMVDAGTAIFKLLDVSKMEIIVDMPVSDYQKQSSIKKAYCKVPGGEEELNLKLQSIAPKADGNQLYRAKFIVENPVKKYLTAGMNVEVKVITNDKEKENGYTLPMSAVFKDGNNTCVWIFKSDSTITKHEVEVSEKISNGEVVIKKGLSGEEKIIRTGGAFQLQEGMKVQPLENSSKTNVGGLL